MIVHEKKIFLLPKGGTRTSLHAKVPSNGDDTLPVTRLARKLSTYYNWATDISMFSAVKIITTLFDFCAHFTSKTRTQRFVPFVLRV